MKVGILVNPRHARTTRAYARLVGMLRHLHIRYRSATTTRDWPGAEQASELLTWGASPIIILGGDGTLRSSAQVLAATGVPVLIFPTGTANVLARHIGIRSVEHALRLAESHLSSRTAHSCAVPVNEADCFTADGPRREHFLSLAGIGGDARAIAERTAEPGVLGTRILGQGLLGYVYGAGRALFEPLFDVKISGVPAVPNGAPMGSDVPQDARTATTAAARVWSVMASKTARPAGPIPVFDHAEVSAEEFEFLAVALGTTKPGDRLGEWGRIVWDCLNRRPAANPAMRYWKGGEISIRADAPAPVQLDGDLIGDCRRLDLRAGTQMLNLVVPD